MITYSCDLAGLLCIACRWFPPPTTSRARSIAIEPRGPEDKRPRGKIPQVAHTYKVLGLMNEHQLAIAETTFGGREELHNPQGLIDCRPMMTLALQRARTAREAIQVMTRLVAEYGYGDEGESISIADTQEAWILEIVGTGPGGKGAAWVAVRIPDGQISCHANASRIGEFPRNDPANCLYSENVESFARSKGWYDPKSGQPFRFCDAYCPATPLSRRICDTRVWSILRRAAPSQHLSPDYHRSKPGAQPYPFSLTPDAKLSAADVFALMRDHYEGTEFDMTQGIDAGPYGLPQRWRPLAWKVDGVEYVWERPISTQQTAFSFVSQSRAWLPDPVGGLYWYGVDDTYTSCYIPLYCGIDALPKSYVGGSNAQVLLGLGLVGLQLRVELRLPEVVVHGPGNSGLPEGHRVELPGPPAGGGEDGGRAAQDQSQPGRALPDRLLGDARRADGRPLAGAGRTPDDEVQRRLRPRHPRRIPRGRLSGSLAPPRAEGTARAVQDSAGEE